MVQRSNMWASPALLNLPIDFHNFSMYGLASLPHLMCIDTCAWTSILSTRALTSPLPPCYFSAPRIVSLCFQLVSISMLNFSVFSSLWPSYEDISCFEWCTELNSPCIGSQLWTKDNEPPVRPHLQWEPNPDWITSELHPDWNLICLNELCDMLNSFKTIQFQSWYGTDLIQARFVCLCVYCKWLHPNLFYFSSFHPTGFVLCIVASVTCS